MPFKEVIEILEFFILLGSELLELILQLLRNLGLIDCGLIEGENLFFFSLQSSAKFCGFEDPVSEFQILFQFFNCISGVVGEFFKSPVFFFPETIHLLFEFLIILGNIVFLLSKGVIPGSAFFLVLQNLELEQVDL
jgi:hypothetical protein